MNIETLLEAIKFLERQALQQKSLEDDLKEKLQLRQTPVQRLVDVSLNPTTHVNDGSKMEEWGPESHPPPVPPSLPSPPVTVTPNPVVTPKPTGCPPPSMASLCPVVAALTPQRSDPHFSQDEVLPALQSSLQPEQDPPTSVLTTSNKPLIQNNSPHHSNHQTLDNNNNPRPQTSQQLPQCHAGSIVSPAQQSTIQPQLGPVVQQPPVQSAPTCWGSPTEEGAQLEYKKRPRGAGTREIHSKLEKHRRAHLKECFETLKKIIPNLDEKKTSNLCVLRSALKYIQTLKRKEKDYEHDMERLAREKIAMQQRLADLKHDLNQWMDVVEIERILRQTVQPEDDQASTSTASEGEDMSDDEETPPGAQAAAPVVPRTMTPELHKSVAHTHRPSTSFITQHISMQQNPHLLQPQPTTPPQSVSKPAPPLTSAAIACSAPVTPTPTLHPTVIAHASITHPSVIQTVSHIIQGGAAKHVTHLCPPSTSSVQLAPPIGHITVHPVTHLSQHLPALYSQPLAITQPTVMGHITHTLNHAHPQVNGTVPSQPTATIISKPTSVGTQMLTHHPQLVGQTVLNPVTMVTMPPFPISTLKLA